MCVLTMKPDGALILDPGPPAVASLCFARVTGFAPDKFVTTQRSRKKRKVGN
jgi:hypothetical protein